MKRKDYERPTAQVVKLEQRCQIMAGSGGGAGVQDFNWNDVPEESRGMDDFLIDE